MMNKAGKSARITIRISRNERLRRELNISDKEVDTMIKKDMSYKLAKYLMNNMENLPMEMENEYKAYKEERGTRLSMTVVDEDYLKELERVTSKQEKEIEGLKALLRNENKRCNGYMEEVVDGKEENRKLRADLMKLTKEMDKIKATGVVDIIKMAEMLESKKEIVEHYMKATEQFAKAFAEGM